MLRLLLNLLLALLLAGPVAAQRYNVSLASPPAGFAWQALPHGKAAALLPAGWYYRAEGQKGAPTYYVMLRRRAVLTFASSPSPFSEKEKGN